MKRRRRGLRSAWSKAAVLKDIKELRGTVDSNSQTNTASSREGEWSLAYVVGELEEGKDSEQFKAWKDIQSEQYDSVFEYRFFYKLRNYCQHVGMPPMHFSFMDSTDQEGISFGLDFSTVKLLEAKSSWNRQMTADLTACPDKISVLDSLNNWSKTFLELSKTLLEIRRSAGLSSAKKIVGHRKRLKLPENVGKLCAVRIPQKEEKQKKLKFRLSWLPENKARELIDGTAFSGEEVNT